MYNEFFGFKEKPFEITPDPKFLYLTSSHKKALDAMLKGIHNRQSFITITGEVGTGKTTLIYALLNNLDDKVKTAFVFHTLISFEEIMEIILRELYLDVTRKDKESLLKQLVEYLSHIGIDETVTVIIDEAHHLAKEVLQELGKLSDLSSIIPLRLQIILVGQPELKILLNSPELQNLNQQIKIRREIMPLPSEESRDYIDHRLKMVGSSAAGIFTPPAISEITRYADGIPRIINILCDNALISAFGESQKKIDVHIIREVIGNLEGPPQRKFPSPDVSRFFQKTSSEHRKRIFTPKRTAVILISVLCLGMAVFLMIGLISSRTFNLNVFKSILSSPSYSDRSDITTLATNSTMTPKVDASYQIVKSPPSSSIHSAPSINNSTEAPAESIIVKLGQSIIRLEQQYYGRTHPSIADLILYFNPEIKNADIISVNQTIRMPQITERNLIIHAPDQTFKIIVGTFNSLKYVNLYRNEPLLQGRDIEVVTRKVTPTITWYRIVVGNFQSKDEALKIISMLKEKNLLPVFSEKVKP